MSTSMTWKILLNDIMLKYILCIYSDLHWIIWWYTKRGNSCMTLGNFSYKTSWADRWLWHCRRILFLKRASYNCFRGNMSRVFLVNIHILTCSLILTSELIELYLYKPCDQPTNLAQLQLLHLVLVLECFKIFKIIICLSDYKYECRIIYLMTF